MLQRIADDALQAISSEIDDIEVAVRAVIPEAKHIDIEVDYQRGLDGREGSSADG